MLRLLSILSFVALPALAQDLRVASFNASLYGDAAGDVRAALEAGGDPKFETIARIIKAVDPDILLVNELDYSPGADRLFVENYLQGAYPYSFIAPSNTGVSTGLDVDGNGVAVTEPGSRDYGNDAFGFGFYEGQFGMVVLSKLPIRTDEVRTFQTFLWRDMPDARRPAFPDGAVFHTDEVWDILRLSSKSHWDVPISVGDQTLHLLASHPTPPAFDDEEQRNKRRNADEIRFWADYIDGAAYMYDDAGQTGGLTDGAHFVIVGDLNSDPEDGSSLPGAAQQLTEHARVQSDPVPSSTGGAAAASVGVNPSHTGNPSHDTAAFNPNGPGNLRVDYALPSTSLTVRNAGVFWPAPGEEGAEWMDASDHRLVWVDITLP